MSFLRLGSLDINIIYTHYICISNLWLCCLHHLQIYQHSPKCVDEHRPKCVGLRESKTVVPGEKPSTGEINYKELNSHELPTHER